MNAPINTTPSTPQKKKKRGSFNFVDLTLIIILLLVVGLVIYSFSPMSLIKKWFGSDTRNIQYEVEFTNVDAELIDKIKPNDSVSDAVTKGSIGTVSMVNNTKYVEYKTIKVTGTEEGAPEEYKVVPIEYPNKYNILVTITVEADFAAEAGYTVNSTRIAVGEKLALKFPDFKCEGYCVGVTEY